MLIFSRKVGEELMIGDNIKLVVKRIDGHRVLVGVDAPREVHIVRGELVSFIERIEDNLGTMRSEVK